MGPVVRAASLRGLPALVESLGGDATGLLTRFGVDPAAVSADDAVVPVRSVGLLLEVAAAELDRPDLGLLLAERQDAGILGPLAVAIENARTLGDAMASASRFLFVHSPALSIAQVPDPEGVRGVTALRYGAVGPEPMPPQATDLGLGLLHRIILLLHGGPYGLRSAHLTHPPLVPVTRYTAFFGADVRFARDATLLRLPATLTEAPVAGGDLLLRTLALDYLESNFAEPGRTVADPAASSRRRGHHLRTDPRRGPPRGRAPARHRHRRPVRAGRGHGGALGAVRPHPCRPTLVRHHPHRAAPRSDHAPPPPLGDGARAQRLCRSGPKGSSDSPSRRITWPGVRSRAPALRGGRRDRRAAAGDAHGPRDGSAGDRQVDDRGHGRRAAGPRGRDRAARRGGRDEPQPPVRADRRAARCRGGVPAAPGHRRPDGGGRGEALRRGSRAAVRGRPPPGRRRLAGPARLARRHDPGPPALAAAHPPPAARPRGSDRAGGQAGRAHRRARRARPRGARRAGHRPLRRAARARGAGAAGADRRQPVPHPRDARRSRAARPARHRGRNAHHLGDRRGGPRVGAGRRADPPGAARSRRPGPAAGARGVGQTRGPGAAGRGDREQACRVARRGAGGRRVGCGALDLGVGACGDDRRGGRAAHLPARPLPRGRVRRSRSAPASDAAHRVCRRAAGGRGGHLPGPAAGRTVRCARRSRTPGRC